MKRILLIGTIVPNHLKSYYIKNNIRPSAADVVQEYMIHGMDELKEIEFVDVLSAIRIPPYPKCPIVKVNSVTDALAKGRLTNLGYLNLPLVGFFHREIQVIHAAKAWARVHSTENVIIFVYSMHSPFMKAALAVKKIIPSAKIALVVADLPLFMNTKGQLRMLMKRIDWNRIQRLMKSMDKYLLYTKYMAEYLQISTDKWIVFEGLVDSAKISILKEARSNEKKTCVYAGNLDGQYGIDTLIKSFGQINVDAELHIYGGGADAERIKSLCVQSKNVKYKGLLTPNEMFEVMKHATLLINPRPSTLGLAKYSCPSKTFEYMASGTPVLMTKLPGLPDEYYPYLYFFETETLEGFSTKIDEILNKGEAVLKQKGIEAAEFLKSNKSSEVQMRKILESI